MNSPGRPPGNRVVLGLSRSKTAEEGPALSGRERRARPQMVAFFAGKGHSIKALEVALAEGQEIYLVPQKNKDDSPGEGDLHNLGVVAGILQTPAARRHRARAGGRA